MLKLHSLKYCLGKSHFRLLQPLTYSVDSAFKSYSSASDRDFLHKSILPTDHFQASLPRLPIPQLEDTLHKYLESQRQILTDDEYDQTADIVNNFKANEGPDLQKRLVAKDKQNKHTSYITKPWFDMYLKSRLPIVLNYNPFVSFQDDPRPDYQNQLIRSTNMIVSSLKFMKTMRANILEPDIYHLFPAKSDNMRFRKIMRMIPSPFAFYGAYLYKAFPLDMSQYKNLFNSTRVPRPGKDELVVNKDGRHLLVMRNGNFYVFDVLDSDGNIMEPGIIMSNIHQIMKDQSPPSAEPVAAFTAEDRDVWASYREKLISLGNEETLKLIDSAVFALCLEDGKPTDPNAITRMFLHGEAGRIWFDKSLSLIMTGSGNACVNFEHAWGDGVAVLRYFNEVFDDSTMKSVVHPSTSVQDSATSVRKLEFKLDQEMKDNLQKSVKKFNATMQSLDVDHLEYYKYTKSYVKKSGMSPDALMQLAIQMAYYRQYKQTVATYESCSTAAFKHGRTETIRPATAETKRACVLFVDDNHPEPSVDELKNAMMACSKKHGSLTRNAAMGKGFDRHLFGLKTLAEEEDGKLPQMFTDPNYQKINHIILSTSTVSSPAILIGGFAPVTQNGYGVGYSIEDSRIGFNVTSYPPATNAPDFIECVTKSLDDMYEVLEGRHPKRSK
ncbi:carnitine O-palmitoyltransferase 2, mitochondrial-like [Saccostrea echinata]|uniref:carnitine O-palmitoyltransferase 2, mitochondrial-like n=1 Tax=Saccostrea echinata TaxID=191078 RepID=UPI002A820D47|nr:carnitine O-palmitoyltransferase 2, mitochondrial-like [Saccostrea echinata]